MTRGGRRSAPERKSARGGGERTPASHETVPVWRRLWPAAVIAAAATAAYANALRNPFVFDDPSTIVNNVTIRDLWTSLGGGPVQLATAGRPLVNFTFALDYARGGVEPLPYHVTNLAILILCGWVLYGVVRQLLMLPRMADVARGHGNAIAASVALVWTLHPVNSEVVNYLTQRTESLMALAYLATAYAALRAFASPRPAGWYVLSVAACAAGMACKESMVTAPVSILLIDAVLVSGSPIAAVRRRKFYYAALLATWIVLALLIVEGPRFRSAGFSSGVDPWTYLLNQAPMLVRYLRVAVLPFGLVLDYGLPRPLSLSEVVVPALAIAALLVVVAVAWVRARRAALAATLVLVLLAPTSTIVPIATEVAADRRMFLPLAVLVTLVICAVWRFAAARVPLKAAAAAVVVVCAAWFALTVQRNAEYHSALGIWQTVVDRWPHGRAYYNLGIALKAGGRRAEAIEQYRRALPDTPEAHYALGFELQADGRYNEAIEEYRTFVRLKPMDVEVPRAYHQIGRALVAAGRPDEAIVAFKEALARAPGHDDSLAGLADTLLGQNRLEEAVAAYRTFLGRNPNRIDALMNLGIALVKLDRDDEARDVFARAVQLQPGNVAAHVNLAYALANTGRYGESVQEFRRALALERDPGGRAEIEAAIAQLMGSH